MRPDTKRSRATLLLGSLAVLCAYPSVARAQAPASAPLIVGSTAPDFSLPGATRYGLLQRPVRLSDYRGKTVVLAFFFQARTKG
ncbi:MAG TPA: redoxin domain-containing protein [Gemmatimonadaceae bacterium]|nr:redoxin domain-containing protein [Gemmatimonadaceae bacterium]